MHDKVRELWPLGALIHSFTQHEGQVHSYEQEGGHIVSQGYVELGAPIEIEIAEVPPLVGERLKEKLNAAAEQMARQQAGLFYQRLKEVTSAAGTAVNAHGKPLSQDLFLEVLERREVNFDQQGRPEGIFDAAPAMLEQLAKSLAEWFGDPTFRKRHEEIMRRKYEAWRDRESNRKLVE